MVYVIDSNSLRVLGNFYPDRFPSLWSSLDAMVAQGRLVSTREVLREIELQSVASHVDEWVASNRSIFPPPTSAELAHVATIFEVPHFRQLIGRKQILKGMPVADPFVIAVAMERGCCVVSEESFQPNAARIPNVCAHFKVDCVKLEGLMTREGWSF